MDARLGRVSVWMVWTRKCGWTTRRIAEREDEESEAAGHVRVASYHASQFTVTIEIFCLRSLVHLYNVAMMLRRVVNKSTSLARAY